MCGVIVVDVESFQSTCHRRDAYIHDHCLRYRHNFALFYQLLDGNLFTHRNTYAILREATSETYGPRVYFPSYIFISTNQKTQKYLAAIYLDLHYFALFYILYLSLSDLTLAINREGIDNPLYHVGCKYLFVCVGTAIGDLCVPPT